jgi:hypothetical protein
MIMWRVALIDSCGAWRGAAASAAFSDAGGVVRRVATVEDSTGHGTRAASILTRDRTEMELILAQVFCAGHRTSAATVAAAIDWSVSEGARLLLLFLGLQADRPVLADAVSRALAADCVIMGSTPARGTDVYPAAYPGVIRATGDARCAPGEISWLGGRTFGGAPRHEAAGLAARFAGQGASVGAAEVARVLLSIGPDGIRSGAIDALIRCASYRGPERRGAARESSSI